nr:right-handed parallel beta-helix repeat-containing protein [Candidatus Neomarinimicrobiota bacterium]
NQVIIRNNNAPSAGGVSIDDSYVNFYSVEISNNLALEYAGGIKCGGSELYMTQTLIENNVTEGPGGGIHLSSSGNDGITVLEGQDTWIRGNTASYGGGIRLNASGFDVDTLRISGLNIVYNTAESSGGGIHISGGDRATTQLLNIQVTQNHANGWGGGIYYPSGSRNNSINNCTISGNSCFMQDGGGGLYLMGDPNSGSSDVTITNSILYNNWPSEIDFQSYGTPELYGVNISYSDWENDLGNIDGLLILMEENNITEDPQFYVNDDLFSLLPTSPCIDTGNPDYPRDPDGTIADMGSQYYHQTYILGDINSDGIIDVLDIIRGINIILGDEPTPMELVAGDMDLDYIITILDIIQIINIILM